MNFDECNKILDWVAKTNLMQLDVADQMMIFAEIAKMVENLKPIYDKYNKKEEEKKEDLTAMLLNLLMNNKKDEEEE